MPSLWHDSGNELFRDDPELARRLVHLAGLSLPSDMLLAPAPTNETDRALSNDLDPDTVLIAGPVRKPTCVVIVELQQAYDPRKFRQWPRYAASKWLRYGCPVKLLVLCPDGATADKYEGPMPTSLEHYTHWPIVLRPARVPVLGTAAEAGADPALGVLSVAYHGTDPAVVNAFAAGILDLSTDDAKKYYEYGLRMSPEIVRNALEHLMATKYNEPFSRLGLSYYGQGREEGREEGLIAGERGTVLMVLKARGLEVGDRQRARIDACDDLATLKHWAEAALTTATVDDLFS